MRPAFLFLGGFKVLCRNRLYLADAERRGLAALLITSAGWRDRTLAALADPDHPAAGIAEAAFVDGQLEVEGSFTAGIVGAVQDLARRWDLRGVYAVGEMMVEQTGLVADALGLPSPGLRATRACRSKYLQRFYCPEWSPPVLLYPPGDRSAPTGEHPGFPAVLKPASRRSSSGVRRVEGQAALDRHLRDYPAAETLLLERYVAGQEYSVEALVQGGRVVMDSVTRKETNEATTASFVELGHTVPAAPGPASDALLAANRAILARLGFADGIAHAEFRITPAGDAVLMEIAARTPGDGILPLYHLATGVPVEPQIMRIALGEPASYPAPSRLARQVYLDPRDRGAAGRAAALARPGADLAGRRAVADADPGAAGGRPGAAGGAGAAGPWHPARPAARVRRPGGDLPHRRAVGGGAGRAGAAGAGGAGGAAGEAGTGRLSGSTPE